MVLDDLSPALDSLEREINATIAERDALLAAMKTLVQQRAANFYTAAAWDAALAAIARVESRH